MLRSVIGSKPTAPDLHCSSAAGASEGWLRRLAALHVMHSSGYITLETGTDGVDKAGF